MCALRWLLCQSNCPSLFEKNKLSNVAVIKRRWKMERKANWKETQYISSLKKVEPQPNRTHLLCCCYYLEFLTLPQKAKTWWSIESVARLPKQVPVDCGFAFVLIYYGVSSWHNFRLFERGSFHLDASRDKVLITGSFLKFHVWKRNNV